MNVGTSQIEITPTIGAELSGFAARTQPSTGILDPLFARGLYLEQGEERLLWLHADVIGLSRGFVDTMRQWGQAELGIPADRFMVSATHTHSGPATIQLREAGEFDTQYTEFLTRRLQWAAEAAVSHTAECRLLAAEGCCNLTTDRRRQATAHTDPRVLALGWMRADDTFAAILLNYAMHAVALGPANRCISADVPGCAARALAELVPGQPVVLVTNGACANLDPPAQNVSYQQVEQWGRQLAHVASDALRRLLPVRAPILRVATRILEIPTEALDRDGILAAASRALQNPAPLAEWGDKYCRAVLAWRDERLLQLDAGALNHHENVEVFAARIGDLALVGLNAEVFSDFTDWVRNTTRRQVYTIGYANGDMGYLPTRAAYQEGGYEVEVACFFYGRLRPQPGALERVEEEASRLVNSLFAE